MISEFRIVEVDAGPGKEKYWLNYLLLSKENCLSKKWGYRNEKFIFFACLTLSSNKETVSSPKQPFLNSFYKC